MYNIEIIIEGIKTRCTKKKPKSQQKKGEVMERKITLSKDDRMNFQNTLDNLKSNSKWQVLKTY